MKKEHLLAYSFVAVLALAIGGLTIASAESSGFWKGNFDPGQKHQMMLENKADILGLSVEELQTMHEEGMTFEEIFTEQGITPEELHEQMMASKIERLDQLLADGDITQEQYDQKLEWITDKKAKIESSEWQLGEGHKGFGKPGMHWPGHTLAK